MLNFLINLNLFGFTYASLAAFAQTIHDGFVANIADYPVPNPLMAAFQSDIDALNAAIAKWGVKGNHGSHADHVVLVAARTVVRNDLKMLAEYAQNKQPNNPDSWIAVGFKIKHPKSKPAVLQVVQNFRHFVSRAVVPPAIKMRWKKPLNTGKQDVKGYMIQRSNTPAYPVSPDGRALANVIGIVQYTFFVDDDPYVGENWYWVTPFNTLGNGVTSDGLLVVSTKTK